MNPARLVQSIGWMAFLAALLVGGGYASYIAAWQQWVLIAATALFGGLVLIDALVNRASDHHDHDHHDHDHGNTTDQWVQTLVHLIPLFLFLTLGVTTLGSQPIVDFTKPAPMSVLTSRHAADEKPPAAQTPPPALGNEQNSVVAAPVPVKTDTATPPPILLDGPTPADPTATPNTAKDPAIPAAVPLPLMELYYPKKHLGVTRVETIGRLMIPTQEEIDKVPPEIDRADLKLLLYRYVMTCCAADASPVFVVLRGREASELKVDDWVKITGTWIPAPGLGDMAKIEVDSMTVIEQPTEPFLQAPKE